MIIGYLVRFESVSFFGDNHVGKFWGTGAHPPSLHKSHHTELYITEFGIWRFCQNMYM